jgi:gamma-glutamyltranspeptidase/glutathione hydrolase
MQAAIDAPRTFATAGNLQVEREVAPDTVADLERRGHAIERVSGPLGGGQAIWMDAKHGTLVAGSDPRKDGCALGR